MKRVIVWILTIVLGVSLLAGVPATTSIAEQVEREMQNYGESADLIITNADELKEFATDVSNSNDYKDKIVVLANDIVFDGKEGNFEPIGDDNTWFNGTFDGQGHTISGIHVKKEGYLVGLFEYLNRSAVVKNLILQDCVFECVSDDYRAFAGAIAAANLGVISDCAVINTQINCVNPSLACVGGVCATNGNMIRDSYSMNSEICGSTSNSLGRVNVGGICGINEEEIRNSYSMNSKIYSSTSHEFSPVEAGGICGVNRNPDDWNTGESAFIINCCNLSDVYGDGSSAVGGIAGGNFGGIEHCYNVGTLSEEDGECSENGIVGSCVGTVGSCYSLAGTIEISVWNEYHIEESELYSTGYMKTADFTNKLNKYVSERSGFNEFIVSDPELNYWENCVTSPYPLPTKKIINMVDCNVALADSPCIYNGKEQTPEVVVTYNGKTLVGDIDYTVAYKNNVNAGTATVTVTGKRAYQGTTSMDFEIQKADQTFKHTTSYKKAYNSKVFKLNAKLQRGKGSLSYKSSNSKIAKVSKNGTVTVKKIGKAIITVTARETANYKKTAIKIPVTVSPKKLTIQSAQISKNKLNIRWGKDNKVKGYEIQYSTDKKFKKDVTTVTIKNKAKVSYKSKKLKKGKTYYVRIRAYKGNIYGAWSKVVQVKR